MTKQWVHRSVAFAVSILFASAAYADRPTTSPPRLDSGEATLECTGGATLTISPTTLWPPNRAVVPVTITYKDDDDEDCLTLNSVTSSQGSAATFSDTPLCGAATLTTTVQLTAERRGNDPAGNIYTIEVVCGEDGVQQLKVTVPHDLGT